MLFELHSTELTERPEAMKSALEGENIPVIHASSVTRLNKYHSGSPAERAFPIYVVDQYDRLAEPFPIDEKTEIFQKYEEIRRIDRLYVAPEMFRQAERLIIDQKL
jgi:hypothetical protein